MRQCNTGHWNLRKLNQHERIFYIYWCKSEKVRKKKKNLSNSDKEIKIKIDEQKDKEKRKGNSFNRVAIFINVSLRLNDSAIENKKKTRIVLYIIALWEKERNIFSNQVHLYGTCS